MRALSSAVSLPSSRSTRSGSAAVTTAPQCGSADSAASAPPPSSTYRCASSGSTWAARPPARVRSTVLRPDWGAPGDQQVTAAGDVEDGRDLPLLVRPVEQAVAQPQRVAGPHCQRRGELGRGQRREAAAATTANAGATARLAPRR